MMRLKIFSSILVKRKYHFRAAKRQIQIHGNDSIIWKWVRRYYFLWPLNLSLTKENISRISTGKPFNLFFSTSKEINKIFNTNLRFPILQTAEIDENGDGISERLEVNFQMPITFDEQINGMNALFFHDVMLTSKAKYLFDALTYTNFQSPFPFSRLYMDGDVVLRQASPLLSKSG